MADAQRVITIVAGTEPKLLAALAVLRAECAARNAVLRQVTEITRYPGGVFVRVRPVDRTAPAPSYRPRTTVVRGRRGPRPVVVVGIVGVAVLVLGVLGALVFFLAGHWRLLVGVGVVVGVLAVLFAGNGKSRSGPA